MYSRSRFTVWIRNPKDKLKQVVGPVNFSVSISLESHNKMKTNSELCTMIILKIRWNQHTGKKSYIRTENIVFLEVG